MNPILDRPRVDSDFRSSICHPGSDFSAPALARQLILIAWARRHRPQPQPLEQPPVRVRGRVGRREQPFAVEDRVRPGEEAQRLELVAHRLAAGGEPHERPRHQDARHRDRPHEVEGVDRLGVGQRRALDPHELVDRHALGRLGQVRQGQEQLGAVVERLAHAEDAAAADVHPGRTHVLERVEPVLERTRADDLAVVGRRRVEVVVVEVEPCLLEAVGLPAGEHAERGAGLQTERFHALDELGNLLDVAIPGRTPGRSHAEAGGPGVFRPPRLGQDRLLRHQLLGRDPGLKVALCGQ